MCVRTCKIFYQKSKCKTFYKISQPHTRLSPPFSYFTHPLSHLPKPTTTPTSTPLFASTLPTPFATLHLHSNGTTIRSQSVLSSEKSPWKARGEPYLRRSVPCCLDMVLKSTNTTAKISDLESLRVSGFFVPSRSGFLGSGARVCCNG